MSKGFTFSQFDNSFILRHPDHVQEVMIPIGEDLTVNQLFEQGLHVYMRNFSDQQSEKFYSQLQQGLDPYDEVWMDGKLYRFDYTQNSKEGRQILLNIKNEFPDETSLDDSIESNTVGQYTSDRKDYPNETFMYYNFQKVSDSLIDRFGLEYTNYEVFGEGNGTYWYGLKFDRTTEDVKCKIVLPFSEISEEIRNEIFEIIPPAYVHRDQIYFAKIHDENKEVSSEIDMFFITIPAVVNNICEAEGLTYPFGKYQENQNLEENIMLWGAVYDTETKKVKHIKGYARFFR